MNAQMTDGPSHFQPPSVSLVDECAIDFSHCGSNVDELPIPLVKKLCLELGDHGVNYCQWKGNWKLRRWAKGEGDLDLLVARSDAQRFIEVLIQLGFKQAEGPHHSKVPGVQHYYGFDAEAGQLVHVHAHFQLILGHYLTNNYRFPIEEAVLASVVRGNLFLIPGPEFELILFVLGAVLKYSALKPVFHRIFGKPIERSIYEGLKHLEPRADAAFLVRILEQHFPNIEPAFFEKCKRSLHPNYSAWVRAAVRQQLKLRMRANDRKPSLVDTLLRQMRGFTNAIRIHILREASKKRFTHGGAIIALVGGDGAGKSTCVGGLHEWLSDEFDTAKVHFGKPPRSLLTLAVEGALNAQSLFGSLLRFNRTVDSLPVRPGNLELASWMCTARDRYRLYVKARRFANDGKLVICDRFPISQINWMDCPRIAQLINQVEKSCVVRFLQRIEESYYRVMAPPDLLIILRAHPEIAVRRKTNENEDYVRERSQKLWQVEWRGTRAHMLDASQPIEQVLSQIKSLVWPQL